MPDPQILNQTPLIEQQLTTRYRTDFSGGVNLYLGPRQIQDNESPNAIDCDFKGSTGIGNRQGYSLISAAQNSRVTGRGTDQFHKSGVDQAIVFGDNASNVALGYSIGSTITYVTTTTLTTGLEVDCIQAESKLYSCNGTDSILAWDGTTLTTPSHGKVGFYPAYFDGRLWIVDATLADTLDFSVKAGDASITDFPNFTQNGTSSNPGTVTFLEGSGLRITGLKVFKDSLYVFTGRGSMNTIWKLATTTSANIYSVTLVTSAVGCVSHRTIVAVENDLMFADDLGVFTLGEVGTYASIRTTNRSLRIQKIFDSLNGTTKKKLAAAYFNYKYHLFYSLYGTNNDSCVPYDNRYQAWQDWRNMGADDATTYTDSNGTKYLYFLEATTGKLMQMYSGTTNNGSTITSTWYSKSFDESQADLMKLYLDHSFVFGLLSGSITVSVIFDDNVVSSSSTITQANPQGGFGRNAFGKMPFGDATNTIVISSVINQPLRLKAKGQKFAVQYAATSTGSWRLDAIATSLIPFGHYKFPSLNKLN